MRAHTDQKELLECQMALRQRERIGDEFLASRNRWAQIAHTLADYIRGDLSHDIRDVRPFPNDALEQVDRARGLIRYEWPE